MGMHGTHGYPYHLHQALVEVLGGRNLPEKELIFETMEKTRMMLEARMYKRGLSTPAIAEFTGVSQDQVYRDLVRMKIPRRPPALVSPFRKVERRLERNLL